MKLFFILIMFFLIAAFFLTNYWSKFVAWFHVRSIKQKLDLQKKLLDEDEIRISMEKEEAEKERLNTLEDMAADDEDKPNC